jgi:hypothetical protein
VNVVDLLKRVGTADSKATAFTKDQTRLVERYAWALVPALVLLSLSFWRELPVRPRARDVRLPVAKPVAARPRADRVRRSHGNSDLIEANASFLTHQFTKGSLAHMF